MRNGPIAPNLPEFCPPNFGDQSSGAFEARVLIAIDETRFRLKNGGSIVGGWHGYLRWTLSARANTNLPSSAKMPLNDLGVCWVSGIVVQ